LQFYGGMHAADGTSPPSAAWFVEPDAVDAGQRKQKAAWGQREAGSSMRAVIVSTLFLIMFTIAILFGGHAAVDPLLRMVTAAHQSDMAGDVLTPMPDGQFCRHMSFDNKTSEMTEGDIVPCPDDLARGQFRRDNRSFSWGKD
jgi:hypothetical protein